MEIISGLGNGKQNHTRRFAIESMQSGYEYLSDTTYPFLMVSLKSHRFHGATNKEHPAKLKISFSELHEMIAAFERDLAVCYQVIRKNGLFRELAEARKGKPPLAKRRPPGA